MSNYRLHNEEKSIKAADLKKNGFLTDVTPQPRSFNTEMFRRLEKLLNNLKANLLLLGPAVVQSEFSNWPVSV